MARDGTAGGGVGGLFEDGEGVWGYEREGTWRGGDGVWCGTQEGYEKELFR